VLSKWFDTNRWKSLQDDGGAAAPSFAPTPSLSRALLSFLVATQQLL
jgi:hypothetical protein